MTDLEQEQFRKEFRSIVYLNSELLSNANYIGNLHVWDKNESHKNAIIKAIQVRESLKEERTQALKGHTYEQWYAMSRKLSMLCVSEKNAIKKFNPDKLNKVRNQINQLDFDLNGR